MSGLFRNFLTFVMALWRYNTVAPHTPLAAWFFITPFDTGIATLKSDTYFQLAESAQVDYMVRTGLVRSVSAQGLRFVNAAQMVRFAKPIRLFSRVQVQTRIVYTDSKCAWFSHTFVVRQIAHAEVVVKMKFKSGPVTVAPARVLGPFTGEKPQWIERWDDALAAL